VWLPQKGRKGREKSFTLYNKGGGGKKKRMKPPEKREEKKGFLPDKELVLVYAG